MGDKQVHLSHTQLDFGPHAHSRLLSFTPEFIVHSPLETLSRNTQDKTAISLPSTGPSNFLLTILNCDRLLPPGPLLPLLTRHFNCSIRLRTMPN
jgi:hypothetical protein